MLITERIPGLPLNVFEMYSPSVVLHVETQGVGKVSVVYCCSQQRALKPSNMSVALHITTSKNYVDISALF